MRSPTRLLCVVGTRPEAIKMAPVILALKEAPWAEVRVLATAQHRHLLDQVLRFFGIQADLDMDVMLPGQTLIALAARLLVALDPILEAERPDLVIAQGDTTTVMAVALACCYHRIHFAHVEAGLRTGDMHSPFPEEANRVVADRLARWHFAPTEGARQNLLREGVTDAKIVVSGNTVIDALLMTVSKDAEIGIALDPEKRLLLVTFHRGETFGEPFLSISRALKTLVRQNSDIEILYPVHPNPNVRAAAHEILGSEPSIHLCEPLDYGAFVAAMRRAYLIISDSGGVQEEAPVLGKPVLVLRYSTERPEAIEAGVAKLVEPDCARIVEETQLLLDDPSAYRAMARCVSPYGQGRAVERIVGVLEQHFGY